MGIKPKNRWLNCAEAFLEQLATIEAQHIVYADEAGMDSQDDYGYSWNEKGKRFVYGMQ